MFRADVREIAYILCVFLSPGCVPSTPEQEVEAPCYCGFLHVQRETA